MNRWHTMDEEPLMCGVVLYSSKSNRIYDGEYIGEDLFQIETLIVHKSQFDCWYQRGEFFEDTGLRDYMNKVKF